jgi:hypothetical protein
VRAIDEDSRSRFCVFVSWPPARSRAHVAARSMDKIRDVARSPLDSPEDFFHIIARGAWPHAPVGELGHFVVAVVSCLLHEHIEISFQNAFRRMITKIEALLVRPRFVLVVELHHHFAVFCFEADLHG